MTNILLICSAGMSTGMMVEKMKKSAEAKGLNTKIWAVAETNATDNVPDADVILIGPQLRFKLPHIKEICNGKPVDVIDMRHYGMMDGEAVLNSALKMAGN